MKQGNLGGVQTRIFSLSWSTNEDEKSTNICPKTCSVSKIGVFWISDATFRQSIYILWLWKWFLETCSNFMWFPKIGVTPVIIHLKGMFHGKPSSYWGTPSYGNHQIHSCDIVHFPWSLSLPRRLTWNSPRGPRQLSSLSRNACVATIRCAVLIHFHVSRVFKPQLNQHQ